MGLLYVLDFGDCTVSCLHLREEDEQFESTEELLKHWGFNPDTCEYMYSSVELDIKHIFEPLK